MSHQISFLLCLLLISHFFSCRGTEEQRSPSSGTPTLLVLQDSLRLAYLGNLMINDYDPESGWFLGFNDWNNEVVLFDREGTIHEQFSIPREGPGAVTGYVVNPKFVNGNIGIFTDAVYELDNKGKLLHKQELPYEFFHYVYGPSNTLYELNGQYLYPKPENEANGRDYVSYYEDLMNGGHILELMDKSGTATIGTMAFPKENPFEKGYFHGVPIPNLFQHGSFWTMAIPNSFEFYVYRATEDGLGLTQAVKVPVEAPHLNQAVPLAEHDKYFQANGNLGSIPGIIFIGKLKNYYLALYVKGLPKTLVSQYNLADPTQRDELLEKRPLEYAIFTEDFKLMEVDLPFPKEIHPFGMVSMEGGQIAGLKNQELFGMEEDFHTVYFYGLKP